MSDFGMKKGGPATGQAPHSVNADPSANPANPASKPAAGSAIPAQRGGQAPRVAEDSNLPHNGQKLKSSATGRGNVPPQKGKKSAGAGNGGSNNKRGASFWVAIIVAVVAVVLACVLALTMCSRSARQGDEGQLDGKTPEEIQAELDRIVEEGMFNISIASVVEFPDGTSPGEVRIENVPGNMYMMKVVITRDDTNEVIYTTDFIEPNHHVQTDTLDVDLPEGSYDCTAMFYAHDMETEELIGQAAAKINIRVLS